MLEVSVVKEYIGLNSLYLLYFCMFVSVHEITITYGKWNFKSKDENISHI